MAKKATNIAWMLFYAEGDKLNAHVAHCPLTQVRYTPIFHTRRDAVAYRKQAFGGDHLVIGRCEVHVAED